MPTGQPYQKEDRAVSAAEDRYLMTVIATASNPRFSVSRVDIDRPGPTYTIDTLRDLRAARGPDDELYFITGADALAKILTWHDVDELFTLAHFVGCTRPGHRLSGAGLPDGKVSLVEIPALAISSTECRARVEAGEPVWYLVPDGVVQYIAKRGLYAKPGMTWAWFLRARDEPSGTVIFGRRYIAERGMYARATADRDGEKEATSREAGSTRDSHTEGRRACGDRRAGRGGQAGATA